MKLNNESKTLFIPLYGKALMSKNKMFINDSKAEEIIKSLNFNFKNLKLSKWLAMYLALRANIIDEICNQYLQKDYNTIVIHLGCGLDSRYLRVNDCYKEWYDVDFSSVIELRKKYYIENDRYKMIGKSVTDLSWLDNIITKNSNVLIIAEGLSMYLSEYEIKNILRDISKKFNKAILVFDAYSKRAVRLSKFKNPVNKMNAQIKWGIDKSSDLNKLNNNIKFIREYSIKDYKRESKLNHITKFIFNNLYCGRISKSLYKIYEFEILKCNN